MTDNDIVKALEVCNNGYCYRDGCPLASGLEDDSIEKCTSELSKAALDLINRQKAEIEKLRKENFELKDGYFQKRYEETEHKELLGLREAWRKSSMDYIDLNAEWEGKYKTAKSEAIKEFAERLKETFPPRDDPRCTLDDCYTIDLIDDLVKEMTEATP